MRRIIFSLTILVCYGVLIGCANYGHRQPTALDYLGRATIPLYDVMTGIGPPSSDSTSAPPSLDAADLQKNILRCMRFVVVNHALVPQRPASLAYKEIEDGLHRGNNPDLEKEVEREARASCSSAGPYPPKGTKMVWKCTGNKEDCAKKERLSAKAEGLINRDVTDQEIVREMERFFAEEKKLSLQ